MSNTETNRLAPLSSSAVEYLFSELANMLGAAALGRMFAGSDTGSRDWAKSVKETWANHLAGFTKRELARGLAAVSERKFPPTLPEFKLLCRPALDPEVAWYEAEHCLRQREEGLMGDWTHPAVWRAGRVLAAEIRAGEYAKNRVRWAVLLKRELMRGFGDGVPEPAMRLTVEQAQTRPPTDEERRQLDALRARMRADATPLSPSEQASAELSPGEEPKP